MKLKITSEKLPAILAQANGKCTAHIARIADVLQAAKEAENQLQTLKLPIGQRVGARCQFDSGSKVPSSYKYRRKITRVDMVRGSREWFVTSICAIEVWPNHTGGSFAILTKAQSDCVVEKFKQTFCVSAS